MNAVSQFLRRVPLWFAIILCLLGLALILIASLIGVGGRFYVGEALILVGFLTYLASAAVTLYGYLYPALYRAGVRFFRLEHHD